MMLMVPPVLVWSGKPWARSGVKPADGVNRLTVGGSGSCGGPGVGRLDLEVGQPSEPSGQVPAAVAEEAQGAGEDDHADERGVEEKGGGDTEAHLLEHDELPAGEATEHGDDDEGGPGDDP